MKSQIIRAKLVIETEIVCENFYGEDAQKCAESACRGNLSEILSQAYEEGDVKVVDVSLIEKKEDLPKHWSIACLPWLPSISFGNRSQEKKIEEFLVKKS